MLDVLQVLEQSRFGLQIPLADFVGQKNQRVPLEGVVFHSFERGSLESDSTILLSPTQNLKQIKSLTTWFQGFSMWRVGTSGRRLIVWTHLLANVTAGQPVSEPFMKPRWNG